MTVSFLTKTDFVRRSEETPRKSHEKPSFYPILRGAGKFTNTQFHLTVHTQPNPPFAKPTFRQPPANLPRGI